MATQEVLTANDVERQLIRIRENFQRHQHEVLTKFGITATDLEVLLFIYQEGPGRMKDIGDRFHIKFSSLTSLVDRLQKLRLVKRTLSKEDRRAVLVHLLRKGNQLIEEYNSQVKSLAEKISATVPSKELPVFVNTLEQVSAPHPQPKELSFEE